MPPCQSASLYQTGFLVLAMLVGEVPRQVPTMVHVPVPDHGVPGGRSAVYIDPIRQFNLDLIKHQRESQRRHTHDFWDDLAGVHEDDKVGMHAWNSAFVGHIMDDGESQRRHTHDFWD